MALMDVHVASVPAVTGGMTSSTATFSAINSGDLLLLFVSVGGGTANITPPAGYTLLRSQSGSMPCFVYGKVAGSSEPLAQTVDQSPGVRVFLQAYRIEGPFTDLSSVVIGGASFTSQTTLRVLAANVSVAANTLVIAQTAQDTNGAATYSNSFANAVSSTFVERMQTARRFYASAASDVHTEVSMASSSGTAQLVRITAQAPPPPTATLVIDTQPENSWNGQTIRPAVVVRMTTNGTTTDTGFTGNMVATRQTGPGTLGGTMTVAAVAGVGTFPNLAVMGSGAHTLRFTANGLTVDSTSFNVATGTGVPGGGSNLAYTEADMQQDVRALGSASQIGEVLILNADGTPATGLMHNTSGLACNASTDGGAASPVTLAAMTLGGAYVSGGFVQINATTRPGWYAVGYPTFPSSGQRRSFTFTGTGLRPATVRVTMTAYDPTADNTAAQATATADVVQTRTIAAVTVVNSLAPNALTASALAPDAVQEIGQEMLLAMAMGRGNRLVVDGSDLVLFGTDGTTEVSRQPFTRLSSPANPTATLG